MEFEVEHNGESTVISSEVEIDGRRIDIAGGLPLLQRDWKLMQKRGVTPRLLTEAGDHVDVLGEYVLYVLRKVDSSLTMEHIDGLTFERVVDIALQIRRVNEHLERPFSTPSTSSPAVTAGAPRTSGS